MHFRQVGWMPAECFCAPWLEFRSVWLGLPVEMTQRLAQRSAGDLKQASNGPVEFEDQKDRAGNRKRTDAEDDDHGCVSRCEEAEAGKDDAEPEHQNPQERQRNRAA